MHPSRRSVASLAPCAALGAAACLAVLVGVGCATAPIKATGEGVTASLRRIDVVEADFEHMTIDVVLAVENTTTLAIGVAAEASVALVGEAPARGDAEAEGAEGSSSGGDGVQGRDGAASQELASADAAEIPEPLGGARTTGTGSGTALPQNTSELPVRVTVPLPTDAAELESLLDWNKVRVHVDGAIRLGLEIRPVRGFLEVAPPHLPEVRLKEAQVASADGGAAGTGFFTLVVENKNPFQVTLDRLAWTVTIDDKELTPSSASGPSDVSNDSIDANQVGEYQTEVQIDEAAFGKQLKTLLKKRSVPYVVQGTMEVRGIARPFRFAGEMKFAR